MLEKFSAPLRRVTHSHNRAVLLGKRFATAILLRTDVKKGVRLKSGDILYVDLANAVGRTIWFRRDYSAEAPIVDLIRTHLKPGDTFFDVGANVGFFSLQASRLVGDLGEVHSFEPLPNLASLLRRSIASNGLQNVWVVEAAVGKTNGAAVVAALRDSAYSHLIGGASHIDKTHGGWKEIIVRAITLDQYVEGMVGRPPRLLKLDIEGSEVDAIDGAVRLLSDSAAPDVVCEVAEAHLARFGHSPTALFERFQAMRYEALDPESGMRMTVTQLSETRRNVFFKKITK